MKYSGDYLVVGGGIFGCYAAVYLARKGCRVLLCEKENSLFSKASRINQARLHVGLHYPRSIATALMSENHLERFAKEHDFAIENNFTHFYAVDKFASFLSGEQFVRFASLLGKRLKKVPTPDFLRAESFDAVFEVDEFVFDPLTLASHYSALVAQEPNIRVFYQAHVVAGQEEANTWRVWARQGLNGEMIEMESKAVINASYASTNQVLEAFGISVLDVQHELAEMVFLRVPSLKKTGLTIMDGPFFSLLPFGKSGVHSLSSVPYTHHKVSMQNHAKFDCMESRNGCHGLDLKECNICPQKPHSNFEKMVRQFGKYLREPIDWHYLQSWYTIKTKLKSSWIDDGRPTVIQVLHENPPFYCIFAGKINSVYEIEKILPE